MTIANTPSRTELPLFIMLLLISFASVNAVLFTPALPDIVKYFAISDGMAQLTITLFLAGYALGQLIYGPLANRLGRKRTIYIGIIIQIISSMLCVAAGLFHHYALLVVARFFLAIGSGVGLKISITMVNEYYPAQLASQRISILMLAFAITPGLGVAIGGILTTYFGWMSCFYAGGLYGIILLSLIRKLPETQPILNLNALKPSYLLKAYRTEFGNIKIIAGAFLVGMCSCFIYLFAGLAPFIAIDLAGMSSENYGFANLIPMIGLALGSLCSAKLAKHYPIFFILKTGIIITLGGVLLMATLIFLNCPLLFSLFFPMLVINLGEIMVLANASTLAMSLAKDKAHAASVINFIGVSLSMCAVLAAGFFTIDITTITIIFGALCLISILLYRIIQ